MPQLLPLVPSEPNYRFGTTLDGTPYLFDVRWNARDEAWYLGIRSTDDEPIRVGIRIVLGALLGRRSMDPRFPAGVLLAIDSSGTGTEAGLDDLGTRVGVYFYPFAEFRELVYG